MSILASILDMQKVCVSTYFSCFYIYLVFPHTYKGWRNLIGSPKLQIIFHKSATKYRSLLWKMTYKDKASYESSPPSISCFCIYFVSRFSTYILIKRTPPPRGGFLFTMFPHQELCVRGPPSKNLVQIHEGT